MNKFWLPAGMLLVFLFVVSQGIASPPTFRIHMDSRSPYFSPNMARVIEGSLIRWENSTGTPHTITHDGCRGGGFCAFESGAIPPSGVFEIPGLSPGTYSYHCLLHPIMRGVLQVVATGNSDS